MLADLAAFGHDYRSVSLQRPRCRCVPVCMYTRVLCGTGFSQLYLSLSITCLCVMYVYCIACLPRRINVTMMLVGKWLACTFLQYCIQMYRDNNIATTWTVITTKAVNWGPKAYRNAHILIQTFDFFRSYVPPLLPRSCSVGNPVLRASLPHSGVRPSSFQ